MLANSWMLFASVFVCDGGIESAMRNDLREARESGLAGGPAAV